MTDIDDSNLDDLEARIRSAEALSGEDATLDRVRRRVRAHASAGTVRGRSRLWLVAPVAIPLAAAAVIAAVVVGNPKLLSQNWPAGLPSPSQPINPTLNVVTSTPPLVPAPSGSPNPVAISQFQMADVHTGWGLATKSTGTAEQIPTVVRTTDGGAHWHLAIAPQEDETPVEVDFHDADHAWVLMFLTAHSTSSAQEVVVASTVDGGKSWMRTAPLRVDGQAKSVQFTDATHGWLFAAPSAGGSIASHDTTLYRTVDGGLHWTAIKPPSQAGHAEGARGTLPSGCNPTVGFPAVDAPRFIDETTGWLSDSCDHPYFYVTHDSGLNWAEQSLPPFPGPGWAGPTSGPKTPVVRFWIDQVISRPGHVVAFVHRGFTFDGGAQSDVAEYVSIDRGATWSAFRVLDNETRADFFDAREGWMLTELDCKSGPAPKLYRTTDGGRDWSEVTAAPQVDCAAQMAAPAPRVIMLITNDYMHRSDDGGQTWTQIPYTVD